MTTRAPSGLLHTEPGGSVELVGGSPDPDFNNRLHQRAAASTEIDNRKPVSWRGLTLLMKDLMPTIRNFVGQSLHIRDERIAAHAQALEKAEERAASLEHRLSRHATHLQNLEGRLKKLETR